MHSEYKQDVVMGGGIFYVKQGDKGNWKRKTPKAKTENVESMKVSSSAGLECTVCRQKAREGIWRNALGSGHGKTGL